MENKKRIYFSLLIIILIFLTFSIFSSLYRNIIDHIITAKVSAIVTSLSSATVVSDYVYDISTECLQDIVLAGQSISANITITNNGLHEGDINIVWWIEDSHGTNYTSSSTIVNISSGETWSSTKSLLVPSYVSAGIYYFKVNMYVDAYSSVVYDTFEVQSPVTTTASAVGGGRGGGGSPFNFSKKVNVTIPNLEILYDRELIVFPGILKFYEIKIKNSGNLTLHNLKLYIQGIELSWFSIEPDSMNLKENEMEIFKINYYLPDSAEIKKYPITILVKSDEIEKEIYLTLNVIKVLDTTEISNKLNILEKQINELEKEINRLRDKGLPVDYLYTLLYDAKNSLELARKNIELGNPKEASELIKHTEIIINSIIDAISEIAPTQIKITWLITLAALITILVIIFYFKFILYRKTKHRKRKYKK
jgi:hypothetical protein